MQTILLTKCTSKWIPIPIHSLKKEVIRYSLANHVLIFSFIINWMWTRIMYACCMFCSKTGFMCGASISKSMLLTIQTNIVWPRKTFYGAISNLKKNSIGNVIILELIQKNLDDTKCICSN